MNKEILDIARNLDVLICEKAKIEPMLAEKWKWRILNEYPDDLQKLVVDWLSDRQLPETGYNNVSIQRILNGTPFAFLDAVDLLYILYKDPAAGYMIFMDVIKYK